MCVCVIIRCVIISPRLYSCSLTEKSCAALSSAVRSTSCSLKHLDLGGNKEIHDAGVQHLSDLLKNPLCKLEILQWVLTHYNRAVCVCVCVSQPAKQLSVCVYTTAGPPVPVTHSPGVLFRVTQLSPKGRVEACDQSQGQRCMQTRRHRVMLTSRGSGIRSHRYLVWFMWCGKAMLSGRFYVGLKSHYSMSFASIHRRIYRSE